MAYPASGITKSSTLAETPVALVGPKGAAKRIDREQLDDLAHQTRLLVKLAQRARLRMLTEVDPAARQRPRTGALSDVAQAAQE